MFNKNKCRCFICLVLIFQIMEVRASEYFESYIPKENVNFNDGKGLISVDVINIYGNVDFISGVNFNIKSFKSYVFEVDVNRLDDVRLTQRGVVDLGPYTSKDSMLIYYRVIETESGLSAVLENNLNDYLCGLKNNNHIGRVKILGSKSVSCPSTESIVVVRENGTVCRISYDDSLGRLAITWPNSKSRGFSRGLKLGKGQSIRIASDSNSDDFFIYRENSRLYKKWAEFLDSDVIKVTGCGDSVKLLTPMRGASVKNVIPGGETWYKLEENQSEGVVYIWKGASYKYIRSKNEFYKNSIFIPSKMLLIDFDVEGANEFSRIEIIIDIENIVSGERVQRKYILEDILNDDGISKKIEVVDL
ncbi:hypothetical protein BCT23_02385 [Enterovibrio norvegicus]|uniref:Uncharacterized protein n=2 Tax=Enterovibrio norvegicus TaxID=188144 RepID=A0A2N7LH81_9GAMM|nr:hypothetical protein BCT23_02385 [Enterovibrio norvegicus]